MVIVPSRNLPVSLPWVLALEAELQLELLLDGNALVHGTPALTVLLRHEVVLVSLASTEEESR